MKLCIQILLMMSFFICSLFSQDQIPITDYVSTVTKENLGQVLQLSHTDQTGFIKFTINLQARPEIYFQENKFRTHFEFLSSQDLLLKKLSITESLTTEQFDKIALHEKSRKIFIGAIKFDQSQYGVISDSYSVCFDVSSYDALDAATILRLKNLLMSLTGSILKDFCYSPSYEQLEYVKQNLDDFKNVGLKTKFPKIKTSFKSYNKAQSAGKLHLITKDKEESAQEYQQKIFDLYAKGIINNESVILVDHVSKDLPPVAGVISSKPTSSNSHPVLLAQMLNAVVMTNSSIFKDKTWESAAKKGGYVFIDSLNPYRLKVNFITKKDYDLFKSLQEKTQYNSPDLKLSIKEIVDTSTLDMQKVSSYGSKTVQFGFIQQTLGKQYTPQGLGIPFYYFKNFLKNNLIGTITLNQFIQSKLSLIQKSSTSVQKIFEVLTEIRKKIESAKIPQNDLKKILKEINKQYLQPTTLFLRSSSNAEDDEQFSGAGLYDSTKLKTRNLSSLEAALKKVWASLYNNNAYLARRSGSMPEHNIAMGVLINNFLENIESQGVSLTSSYNLGDEDYLEINFAGFPGTDYSITAPPLGVFPEESTLRESSFSSDASYDVTQFSSLLPNLSHPQKKLLKQKEANELFTTHQRLYESWPGLKSTNLDIEWFFVKSKTSGQNEIRIVQARPVIEPKATSEDDHYYLGVKSHPFQGNIGESSDGLFRLQAEFPVKLSTTSFNIHKPKDFKISQFEFQLKDGSWIKAKPLLKERQGSSKWTFLLENAVYPSLELEVSVNKYLDKQAKVLSLFDLQISLSAELSDFVKDKQIRDRRFWRIEDKLNNNYSNGREPYTVKQGFLDKNTSQLVFLTEGKSTFGGYDKTFFYNQGIKTMQLNLWNLDWTVTNPLAMSYSPGHHNFDFEYVMDLYYADEIDNYRQNLLDSLNIRYIIARKSYSNEPKIYGLSSEGKIKTVLYEGNFKKIE